MNDVMPYVIALVPSIGVGILFWIVIKNMIEGDRKERLAHSQWEAAQEKKRTDEAAPATEKNGRPEVNEQAEANSGADAQENHNGNS